MAAASKAYKIVPGRFRNSFSVKTPSGMTVPGFDSREDAAAFIKTDRRRLTRQSEESAGWHHNINFKPRKRNDWV